MPPSCPLDSHDSGLFHGTLETACPEESTLLAEGVVSVEHPVSIKSTGRKSRME